MHTHRPLRYSRSTLLRSAFKSPDPCIRFTVEVRHAVDQRMRGGDLFEAHVRVDGSIAILIADVSSKGPLSIVHTEMMRRAFRMCAITERSPASMMSILNRLRFNGAPSSQDVTFASGIIAAFEPGHAYCRYASAGHDIGLLVRGRSHRHLLPTGPLLGIIDEPVFTDCLEPFGESAILLLATDGFTECRNALDSQKQFGTTGIALAAADAAVHSTARTSRAVARSADAFTAGRYCDDATLAVIARNHRREGTA